jgi:hypothetical protein
MQPIRRATLKPQPVSKFPWGLFGILVVLILVSLLSGCFSAKEKIVVKTTLVHTPIVCPAPMKPQPIKTKPLNPKAIQDQESVWWVGLSPDEYGNLAINTEESIRFIKDQNGVVRYYQGCISDFNETVERLNGKPEGETSSAAGEQIQTETSEEVTE